MHATKNLHAKWIKFKLTDAVGMKLELGNDSNWANGFFNNQAEICIFPGKRMMIAQSLSSLMAGVVNALNHTLPTLNHSTHLQLVGGS